jgi:anti-sigma B factor antagonist
MELSGLVSVDVEHRQSPPVALIRVSGELDFGTTPRLVAALSGSPGPGEHLVFDLTGLQFCDSSGLGALIAAHKLTEANGTTLYLTGVAPTVRTAIEITSLDQLFKIRDDLASVFAEIESV